MSPRPTELSRAQARRIALAAQGFCDPPHARPTMRTLRRAVDRTGLLQVDSVNVLARAHLMPLYSRIGPYDTGLLDRASSGTDRLLVEYWAHVQALMPVALWPAMQYRREEYRARRGKWSGLAGVPEGLDAEVLALVAARGPVTARDLEEATASGPRRRDHWGWNWSVARRVLDYLYMCGDVAISGRNASFEVRYDLPERVLPASVLQAPTPSPAEAARLLIRRAAERHGVATARCLADYHRMTGPMVRTAIAELVEDGALEEVRIQGWERPAYLAAGARTPRRVAAQTLLSPFDPLVWERERLERIFEVVYRLEIYVPAAQRRYGYYVLPFLAGERITARVDLKADRAGRRLLVQAAYAEPGAHPAGTHATALNETADGLMSELFRMSEWLGLDDVVVGDRGDLADRLRNVRASRVRS